MLSLLHSERLRCVESVNSLGVSLEVIADWPKETCKALCEKDTSFKTYSEGIFSALKRIQLSQSRKSTQKIKSGKFYKITNEVTLEYLKPLHSWVISFPEKAMFLGQGRHKKVTKVILVRKMQAHIAAHCWGDMSTKQEVDALNRVKDMPGVVPYFGAVPRKNGKFFSIYLLYCNGGELRAFVVQEAKERLPFQEKIVIARDAAIGLKSLHERGLIHYDVHAGNVFMVRESGQLQAFLGDFGHTFLASSAGNRPGYVAARRTPAESLRVELKNIDRFKTDIHALGSVFYEIAWHHYHPWGFYLPRAAAHQFPRSMRKMYYQKIVSAYSEMRKKLVGPALIKKSSGIALTPEERFQILTFEMMHYLPEQRPSLPEVIAELNSILAELE